MHGDADISKPSPSIPDTSLKPRKANNCFTGVKHEGPPKMLFDQFWREGELALLFGAHGTGKSVLATQIADGLARGRGIPGFGMTAKRQRVLYVDLRLSERQFCLRYSSDTAKNGVYTPFKFADELHRQRPGDNTKLWDWLRKAVEKNGYRVIVIDDLSAIRNTADGTRETLELMRELRRLKDELDLSILVLAGCREPGRSGVVEEADLRRSRILCDFADNVFAIGRHPRVREERYYIVQTRCSNARPFWNTVNAPICSLSKIDGNFLGFTFDSRFRPKFDPERLELICNLHLAREDGATFRDLADIYNVPKTTAARLLKQFQPWMLDGKVIEVVGDEAGNEENNEPESDEENGPEPDEDDAVHDEREVDEPTEDQHNEPPPEPPPPEYKSPREILLALGMKRSVDENDREIFIEKQSGTRRVVWYRFDARNPTSPADMLVRLQSNGFGDISKFVDGPVSPFNTC